MFIHQLRYLNKLNTRFKTSRKLPISLEDLLNNIYFKLVKENLKHDKSMMFNVCVSTHVHHKSHMPMNG